MRTLQFELKDHLNHPKYEWPKSPVRYPLAFERGEARTDSLRLLGPAGEPVPMQLLAPEEEGEWLRSATLCFMTDLPRGADYTYTLQYGEEAAPSGVEAASTADRPARLIAPDEAKGMPVGPGSGPDKMRAEGALAAEDATGSNGPLIWQLAGERAAQETAAGGPLPVLRLGTHRDGLLATAYVHGPAALRELRRLAPERGPVCWEEGVRLTYTDGSRYELRLRTADGLEHFELLERMDGFAARPAAGAPDAAAASTAA
ncbi:hypothetical protein IDH44_26120, partial [Paenibacillus sp. IB182496]